MTVPARWLSRAGTNCYSCLTGKDVCAEPPKVLYHQYLDHLNAKHWEGNLLAFKSYLLTQARIAFAWVACQMGAIASCMQELAPSEYSCCLIDAIGRLSRACMHALMMRTGTMLRIDSQLPTALSYYI